MEKEVQMENLKMLQMLEKVIGMTEKEAVKAITDAVFLVRVKYDGMPYLGDCALVKNRITITIYNDRVICSSVG